MFMLETIKVNKSEFINKIYKITIVSLVTSICNILKLDKIFFEFLRNRQHTSESNISKHKIYQQVYSLA